MTAIGAGEGFSNFSCEIDGKPAFAVTSCAFSEFMDEGGGDASLKRPKSS